MRAANLLYSIAVILSVLRSGGLSFGFDLFRGPQLSRFKLEDLEKDSNAIKNLIGLGRGKDVIPTTKLVAGCWKVVKFDESAAPAWTKYSNVLSVFSSTRNRNFQIFSSNGSFVNLSEYNGDAFFATASGDYVINKADKRVIATVKSVKLNSGNRVLLTLPVTGQGLVRILYADDKFRVLGNEKDALVLQTKVLCPPEYKRFQYD
jgi:hypothetical protein